jgi:chemotaxis protein MotB
MAHDQPVIIIKKKKAHGHGHHGGSWKVAYADFVTAMMAFFMVMWILGLSDDSKSQISGYFNDPFGYSKSSPLVRNIVKFPGVPVTSGRVEKQTADLKKQDQKAIATVQTALEKKIRQALLEGKTGSGASAVPGSLKALLEHIDVTVTDEGLRIEFLEDHGAVFFDSGSAVLRREAIVVLKELAPILEASGRVLTIEGHTDARPYGSGAGYDNWDLSQDRANAMRRALVGGGLDIAQIGEVTGFADKRPKIPTEPLNPLNRRVSILLPVAKNEDPVNVAGDITQGHYKTPASVKLTPSIDVTKTRPVLTDRHSSGH